MSEHGTTSHYHAGCRCAPCTKASTDYMRAYRAKSKSATEYNKRYNRIAAKASRMAGQHIKKTNPELWQEFVRISTDREQA